MSLLIVLAALAFLMFVAYRGYSVILFAPVAALGAVLLTVVWSGVVSFIAYFIVDKVIGLRVNEEDEREGLDISSHGETAYHN